MKITGKFMLFLVERECFVDHEVPAVENICRSFKALIVNVFIVQMLIIS